MARHGVPGDFIFMPHDLVRLQPSTIPEIVKNAPGWVAQSLARAPFAVVRRASQEDGAVPLGIRGGARHERHAIALPRAAMMAVYRPEQLLQPAWPDTVGRVRTGVPALALLADIEGLMHAFGLRWGPIGSIGFELASKIETAHAASDLDLLLRTPALLQPAQAAALFRELDALARCRTCRLDIQLETPRGAISLAEYVRGGPVLLRTVAGPLLVSDPWTADDAR
jgi:phosphoribosyl-dephospho-CoA transferase